MKSILEIGDELKRLEFMKETAAKGSTDRLLATCAAYALAWVVSQNTDVEKLPCNMISAAPKLEEQIP